MIMFRKIAFLSTADQVDQRFPVSKNHFSGDPLRGKGFQTPRQSQSRVRDRISEDQRAELTRHSTNKPKAEVDETEVRKVEAVAGRRPRKELKVEERTAAQPARLTAAWPGRVIFRTITIIITTVPVTYPLPRVPGHAICAHPAFTGWLRIDGGCLANLVFACVGFALVERVTPRVNRFARAARRIFPFRLGWQPGPAPFGVRFGFIITDTHARLIRLAGSLRTGCVCVGSSNFAGLFPT